MRKWQRSARLVIAVFGVLFAVFVAREMKRRDAPGTPGKPVTTDPGAVVETIAGHTTQFKKNQESVSITFDKQRIYEDGTSRLEGATIVFDEKNGDRTFTITGKEGKLGKNATTMVLDGAVKLVGSDGTTVLTEHASYAESDGVVRAPGPVEMTKGRQRATGVGMTWEKMPDVLTILDQAVVHVAPEQAGEGPSDVTAATAIFARRDKTLRFERGVKMVHSGQNIEASTVLMFLSRTRNGSTPWSFATTRGSRPPRSRRADCRR
jgi:LPS export ABC transporter protein LptC